MNLIKVQGDVATREPIPTFLVGLAAESLVDLSWVDPALGVSDSAWWPVDDQSPALGQYESYGAESLEVDSSRQVVVCVRSIVEWTTEQIAASLPEAVPMLNLQLVLIEDGKLATVQAILDGMTGADGAKAQAYWAKALTARRDNYLVAQLWPAIGYDEAGFIDAWARAAALNP